MTAQELKKYIAVGKSPAAVYCERKYDGIWCVLRVVKGNKVFMDFADTYDDGDSEGGFRATFIYDSFEQMIRAIEDLTQKELSELQFDPCCDDKSDRVPPDWDEFKWDLYNGNVRMLSGYADFSIGSLYWEGLYKKAIRPDHSDKELKDFIKRNR